MKNFQQLYQKALAIKSAIPHPRIMGIIRECGGKMHMAERQWAEAATDFFEAFKNYDEAGNQRRIQCLKYVCLLFYYFFFFSFIVSCHHTLSSLKVLVCFGIIYILTPQSLSYKLSWFSYTSSLHPVVLSLPTKFGLLSETKCIKTFEGLPPGKKKEKNNVNWK